MRPKNPVALFSKLYPQGESIKVSTAGNKIVLPTGKTDLLTTCNEFTGNPKLVSIAESPFGGLKGSGSPDYCPGTIHIISGDGVYLTDINGQNTSKTLTSGKLIELGNLSIDVNAHAITEEFILENISTSNNKVILSACEDTINWAVASTATQASDNTNFVEGLASLKLTCGTAGEIRSTYNPTGTWDLSTPDFFVFRAKGVAGKTGRVVLYNDSSNWAQYSNILYNGNWQTFILPLKDYQSSGGTPDFGTISYFYISMQSASVGDTLNIDSIFVDVGEPAFLEIQVPDNLASTSAQIYTHNGTNYQLYSTCGLDPDFKSISGSSANFKAYDGTAFNDIYGMYNGYYRFPKGAAGQTKVGSWTGTQITYSTNAGVKYRIGMRVDLPPSDDGRTNINKTRIKIVIYYDNKGSSSYEFEDSTNASYGLQNLVYPWISIYNPDNKFLDTYLFTYKPKNLVFKKDESGTIYEIELFPGNGSISHIITRHPQLTLDSNSDYIPDCLSIDHEGSIAKLLKTYTFVEDWFTEVDLSASSIVTNNFGITADSLDIIPYAVSEGDMVSDVNNHIFPVAETINTSSGDVSLIDVRGLNTIRIRDTAYTNSGDCKVFDTVTMGNYSESSWIKVCSTDHTFTGNCVIENGLTRYIIGSNPFIKIYYFNGISWVFDRFVNDSMSGANPPMVFSVAATSINNDQVVVQAYLSGHAPAPDDYYYVNLTLKKGDYFIKCELLSNSLLTNDARFYDQVGSVGPLIFTDTIHDFRTFSSDLSYTLSACEGIGISIDPAAGALKVFVEPKGSPFRYRISSKTYMYAYTLIKQTNLPYTFYLGSIPYNCSMLYFEAESMGLSNGAVYYTGTDAYPGSGNTGITLQVTGSKTYSNPISFSTGDYLVFMRAQSPGSGRLSLNLYSGVNVQKSVRLPSADTAFSLVSATLSISSADAQVIDNFKIYNGTTDPVTIDYILFVPTSFVKKYAQRALWQALPATKVIKKLPR